MDELGEIYFQRGINLFEEYKYEEAVKCFIHAYELNVCKDEIIEILYSCFITPNEGEFQKTYLESAEAITAFPYEETEIDFIPVAEGRYYLFERMEKKFYGVFDVPSATKGESRFHSLLISDVWDIRDFTRRLMENEYATLYYVLNEQKSKFYSFFKLPGFAEVFLKNAICFENTEIMENFFREDSDVYLPKAVIGKNVEYYNSLMSNINDCRKRDTKTERKNVFLTIGIPSYNRGHVLVKNVKHMLEMLYDSEVEIVVSDNGSTENVDGYQEIREMQDSRVKYVRLEENQGYAANVLNVLKHATGRFVMLASDEDILVLETLAPLLDLLYQNITIGEIAVTGTGGNFYAQENKMIKNGVNAVSASIGRRYLTGIIYNCEILSKYGILELCQSLRDNLYIQYYVHVVIGMFITQHSDFYCSQLAVWRAGKVCGSFEEEDVIFEYMTPESRVVQLDALMELIEKMYGRNEIYEWFFITYMKEMYILLAVLRKVRSAAFEKKYTWKEVCTYLYQYSIQKAEREKLGEVIKEIVHEIYLDFMKIGNCETH